MKLYFQQTAIGKIGIAEDNGFITNLYFENNTIPPGIEIGETDLIKEAFQQLEAYLAGERKEFSLPLATCGTEFMRRTWSALCDIPYGETASYKDIAVKIDNPKAVRAVGLANNRNPIPIFIPCHRVIGANGKLVGYGGGLELKEKLLRIEKEKGTPKDSF
jgi:methylated-DNA-[protein]-cysteine S-methyltransferase